MLLSPPAEWIRPKVRTLLQDIEQTLSGPAKFDAGDKQPLLLNPGK